MSRVSFELPPNQKLALVNQARSLGVSLATYARNLVLDGSKRDRQDQQDELLWAIRAAVLVVVETIGRTEKLSPDLLQRFTEFMLHRYEKEKANP
jgi:hypothetical protein